MGDVEAPEPNQPRQTVLLSILPSKEFATSRKGMLLLAEVVSLCGCFQWSVCGRGVRSDRLQACGDKHCLLTASSSYRKGAWSRNSVLSFVSFVCFTASAAAAFVTVPLLEFLAALFLLFAYSTKFNERFKSFRWPLMDFMRCVTASIIYFIVSIVAVSRYWDGSSKAAGIFGFCATIVFALDFYLIFNELATFLKEGGQTEAEAERQRDDFSDSDSD